jgi:hypothetical protein
MKTLYKRLYWLTLPLFILTGMSSVLAQAHIDIEIGLVTTGYNDVRIPGSGGSFLSLSDELNASASFYHRIMAGYSISSRHQLVALYAPLTIKYTGIAERDIVFRDKLFTRGEDITATYMFNSYRLTYRYFAFLNSNFVLAIGPTVKIRHAHIGISGTGTSAIKKDLGGVPLVHLYLHWKPVNKFGVLLQADALAAPQGRAEDAMVAITYNVKPNITLRTGYRLLEGGADNSVVYTFSMFHYGLLGIEVLF